MTRETKFALIIGFTLILVVGVLITDHFSARTRASIADMSGLDAPGANSMPPEPLVAMNDLSGPSEAPPRRSRETPGPIIFDQSSGNTLLGSNSDSNQAPPFRRSDPLDGDPRFSEVPRDDRTRLDPEQDLTPQSQGLRGPSDDRSTPNPSPEAPPPLPQSQALVHTVQKNDSMYDIAKLYYGKGSVWPKLAAANPGKVGKEGAIREGTKLTIPQVLDGIQARGSTMPPENPPAPSPVNGSKRSYTVKSGDTLQKIAKRELGSSRRYEEIMELNPKISHEDEIYAGMVLTLPAR